jgi:hypothetical protein
VERGQQLDIIGSVSFLTGFTALLIGLTQGGIRGWESEVVIVSLLVAALLIPTFVLVELRANSRCLT